jgi:ribonuclease P protein component
MHLNLERIYETPVSTVKNPPQASARISQPEFEQERQGHAGQPPPRGPQTADAGLIRTCTPDPPGRLGLGRQQRLTQNRDFMRVRAQGQRLVVGCLIANWQVLPEGAGPQAGSGHQQEDRNAVARSRARRLLRESFRHHQYELAKPVELVLVARPSIANHLSLAVVWHHGWLLVF